MPIAQDDQDDGFPSTLVERIHQTQPRVVSVDNITPVVDTRFEPISSLLQHINGSAWIVDYFSQVVTRTSEAGAQQPSQHPVYQQYINIKELELRVIEPLTYIQDSTTNESALRGSAGLYPGVVANEGDMFIADTGDGRMGVYTITEVVRKSQLIETCYEITYSFTGYSDNNRQLLNDLLVKTVKTDYFVKELLGTATKPFLAEEAVLNLTLLKKRLNDLVGLYFSEFFSPQYRTFILPVELNAIYDPYVSKALTSVLDVQEHPLMAQVKLFNIDSPENMQHSSIFSVVLDNQLSLLRTIPTHMWMIGTRLFNSWPLLGSVYHSRLDYVVYPTTMSPGCYGGDSVAGLALYPVNPAEMQQWPLLDITQPPVADPNGTLLLPPLIHPVTSHEFYVLSPAFYQQLPAGLSVLELLIRNVLDGQPFNPVYLLKLFDDINNWSALDRFYQMPMLIILMKIACRRIQ